MRIAERERRTIHRGDAHRHAPGEPRVDLEESLRPDGIPSQLDSRRTTQPDVGRRPPSEAGTLRIGDGAGGEIFSARRASVLRSMTSETPTRRNATNVTDADGV